MRCRPAPVSPRPCRSMVRASVSALDSAGKPLITRSVTLWMATRGSNVFQSTSGSLDAAVLSLASARGVLPPDVYAAELDRLLGGRAAAKMTMAPAGPPILMSPGGVVSVSGQVRYTDSAWQHPSGAPRAGGDTRRRVRWLCIGHHREHQRHRQLHGHGKQRRRRRRGGPRLVHLGAGQEHRVRHPGLGGHPAHRLVGQQQRGRQRRACRPPRLGAASPTGVGVVGDGAGGRPRSRVSRSRGCPPPGDRFSSNRSPGRTGPIRPGRSDRGS